jgi:hypothetical protein
MFLVSDFLDEKRREIDQRLREVTLEQDALRSEEQALRAASKALGTATGPARRGPGRPPGSGSKRGPKKGAKKGTGRRGRPRGGGTRSREALALVQSQPGITIPELATSMGIKQNYLYRVMPSLQKDKKVSKKGRGWYPVQEKSA